MVGRRRFSGLAGTVLVVALSAPASIAGGQALPSPAPTTRADENASIVKPLVEIGRVHSRTPYCGALARARYGIESAITFEYSTPILANDLRRFRTDSGLTKAQSMKKTERDLTGLWNLAVAGRDDVRALRAAANADGVGDEKRKEMLAFADALDGAKARQMQLAKSMARAYAVLAEKPVHDIVHDENADTTGGGSTGDALAWKALARNPSPDDSAAPNRFSSLHTTAQVDAIQEHKDLQQLFTTFGAESFIREDLKNAAQHGNAAVQLGGCSGV
ncbi:MAG: hypothetical protein M3N49_12825 [Candidatus Eremiobacteraeota bacterium]|nr:hypothetical protein [Candidatus Eremiobacteraeota bacterium]